MKLVSVTVFINAIDVFVNRAYSTSQLNKCNMANMNALLEVECKGNVILVFLWSIVIFVVHVFFS